MDELSQMSDLEHQELLAVGGISNFLETITTEITIKEKEVSYFAPLIKVEDSGLTIR